MPRREQLENPRQGPVTAAAAAGKRRQVLADGQAGKDAALLRHETEAEPRDEVRREHSDIAAVVADASGPRVQVAHECVDGRGEARAVSPKRTGHLALP